MVEKLGIEESKIENLGNLLYKNYGTTMAGLRAIGYNFDYDEYHRYANEQTEPSSPTCVSILCGTLL